MSILLKPGETLSSSKVELGIFIEHDPTPCCIINKKGRIFLCNSAFSNMLDAEKDEIVNKMLTDFIHADSDDIVNKLNQMHNENATQKRAEKVTLTTKRGASIYAEYFLTFMETRPSEDSWILAHFIDNSESYKITNLFDELSKLNYRNRSGKNSRDEIFQQFITICKNAFEGDFSYCFFADHKNDSFKSYFWSASDEDFCLAIPPDFSFSSATVWTDSYFTHKNLIFNKQSLKNIPNITCLDKLQLNSMITATIYNDEEPVGVLGVANKRFEYNAMDLRMLEYAAFIFSNLITIVENKKREESIKSKMHFAEMKLLNKSNELLVVEQKLNKIQEELEKTKQQAVEHELAKKGILQTFSQELRTPMNAIIGFADLLKEEEVEEKQKNEFVNIINKSSKQIMQVVNNVLDLAKIENKSIEILPREFSVNTLIRELVTLYIPVVWSRTKGQVRLFYNLGLNDGKDLIIADEKRMRQILNILLDNAAKYTSEGEIEVAYKVLGNNFLLFWVRDTGPGIESECLETIFDNSSENCRGKFETNPGINLGLNISKKLVNLMGGEIWVESKLNLNDGATFFFTLPYKIAKQAPIRNLKKSTLSKLLLNRKILVAEDDPMSYQLLEKILTSSGAEVIHAENGKEAVDFVKTINDFDLVLMDIRMPVMDGIEATKIIKEYNNAIPVIIQTAFTMYEDELQARSAGCDDFISKPIHKDQLLTSILENIK